MIWTDKYGRGWVVLRPIEEESEEDQALVDICVENAHNRQ